MRTRLSLIIPALVTATAVSACGGGGGDIVNPPGGATGSFIVTLSSPTLTLAPGATQTLVVTVTRTGGFTGAVTLAATPLPANVTATFAPATQASGVTTSTLTLVAGAAAVNGLTAITVSGTAAGLSNQSAGLQLTIQTPVQGAASFTIATSVTGFIAPAATLTHLPTIGITRDAGYTGAITFSASGLPPGLVAIATPTAATGNSVSLAIINAGVAAGTYTATIRAVGASGGGERTATVQILVGPPTTGNITWRICSTAPRYPSWFVAVKDGSGAWSRVIPGNAGTTYSFNVLQPTGSVAFVTLDSGVTRTTVYNATQAELTALAANDCTLYPNGSARNVNGTVSGLTSSQQALAGMGWWFSSTINPFGNPTANYSLINLPSGNLDLVAFRAATDASLATTTDRLIIRRALNPASGSSNAVLDFNSVEAVNTTTSTWTVNNAGGASFGTTETFTTVGGSTGQLTPGSGIDRAPNTRTINGVPLAQTLPGDLHQVVFTIGTITPQHASRQIIAYSRTIADRTVAFGPVMPTPTVSSVSVTGAAMLRAQGTVPTEYNAGITLDVKSTGAFARFATVHNTRGFVGGSGTYDVRMPDLTQVFGWDTNWSLRPGDLTNWWVAGGGAILDYFDARYIFPSTQRAWTGTLPGITAPADGNVFLFGRAAGSITP